ncbi:MAG: stimulus-sensing domain-containing protein [Proteobacteria bacterium]|nr:stimulus-sensing domain-containing protein [Pseudomonadota bacterium]MDA1357463.1 stimulus-sensing domain-containing protein [Pseudomonadota bacterium]
MSVTNSPNSEDISGATPPEISLDETVAATISPARASSPQPPASPPLGQAAAPPRRWRIPVASLTARILAINVLALAIVVGGFFYLDRYQSDLFDAKLAGLAREGALIAGALGESVVVLPDGENSWLDPELAGRLIQRLALPPGTRARLFDSQGILIVDSLLLPGSYVQTKELPPPVGGGALGRAAVAVYDWVITHLPPRTHVPRQSEPAHARAADFPEAARALVGENASTIRETEEGVLIGVTALPVQPLRRIQGALLLSSGAEDVARSVRDVRFTILEAFAVALAITVLLSLYFARTITRPVRRLAEAAERVRAGRGRKVSIPDFTARRDEIGGLSRALRDMTQALWVRMDAIEIFVADVAHEIKNPLSSVRNAVETARRVRDPAQRDKLLDIVGHDITRLDRLLSEITDASRIDTEMSRADAQAIDIGAVLMTLVEMHRPAFSAEDLRLCFTAEDKEPFMVYAVEDRLVQVFQNLLSNARSFSPPGGEIEIRLARANGEIRVDIEDQGPGVAEDLREAIFERFYTLRPENEPFGAHSGLGLSISRQITAAHGGTITCTSRRAHDGAIEGARFTLCLPVAGSGER